MDEKRKAKRLPLKLELTVSSLFKQDYQLIPNVNASINVKNISKTGLGFTCCKELPLGYYFDAKIELTEDKYFHAVLKIVRTEKLDNEYFVGCEFVGLAEILSRDVDIYEQELLNQDPQLP